MKQAYALDALAFVGALMVSANDVMLFWYCVAAYILFKTVTIYTLRIFRKESLEYEINNEVERKLLELKAHATRQLARGDHSPIWFHR